MRIILACAGLIALALVGVYEALPSKASIMFRGFDGHTTAPEGP